MKTEPPLDLVKVTATLEVDELIDGYRHGLFPMGDLRSRVIAWYRPHRRAILPLDAFHTSRSLARTLRHHAYQVAIDRDFAAVVDACADRPDVWITPDIRRAYVELHRRGLAHSLEILVDGKLAGGLYGVHLGGVFCAESKFHRLRDMSKVALAELVARLREAGFALLDVQYWTEHLAQFGVIEISATAYAEALRDALTRTCRFPATPSGATGEHSQWP